MNTSMKQKDSQIREQTWLLREGKGEKGGSLGLKMPIIMYRTDKHQGYTVQHRNYIQYSVIDHNEKQYEKEYLYRHN